MLKQYCCCYRGQ